MGIKYRTEIDGLRAIAVLLVILNHLGISYFSGGFVGVDVFFVISGFLITSIIKQEIENNTFSFANFYKKRVIRLAPSYFLVLAVTTIVMWFIATPNDLTRYIESALYSSVFAANFYMWRNIGGYFSANAELTPLLHLWSLGVEEQFYIFWPIALILLIKYFRKIQFLLVIITIILCVAISEAFSFIKPDAAYFLLPFRVFELLIGAILVFLPPAHKSPIKNSLFSLIGVILIFYSALFYTDKTVFPGLNALIPCLGTGLIIYFCRDGLVNKILSSNPLTFVGKISYPAYLWHWPLIVFLNFYYIEINFFIGALTLSLTLFLSWLTYEYVEKRFFIYRNSTPSNVILKGYLAPLCTILLAGIFIIQSNGIPSRFDRDLIAKDAAVNSVISEMRSDCINGSPNTLPDQNKCKLGIEKNGVDFLLIGDSYANHFAPMIDVFAKNASLKGYDVTQDSTAFLPNINQYSLVGDKEILKERFKERNDALISHISNNKYKYVVIAGSYAGNYGANPFVYKSVNPQKEDDVLLNSLKEAIDIITKTGAIPILIIGSPSLGKYDQNCPVKKYMYKLSLNCNIDISEHNSHFSKWLDDVRKVKNEYPSLSIIDPLSIMCSDKECFSELEGVPLYKDRGHLNFAGSTLIGELYLNKIGNPFKMN